MTPHYLDRLFAPRSIAVFGASPENTVGGRVLRNLTESGFEGAVYAINPRHRRIRGRQCYPSLADVGRPVDLAVIATPAVTVPGIIGECGENGVGAAIVLSAGFGEGDGDGAVLRRSLVDEGRRLGVHVLGPNCLGVLSPHLKLNATFSKGGGQPGSLALVSQSGALCTAILDWAAEHQVGFSSVVSLGDAADVGFGDVLDYLAVDAKTESILLYVEGIRHARRFMSGLRVAARLKPVIVLKAGRHEAGSRAAVSHTAALVGGDDAFDAALRRAGAVRVMTIEQLFAAAQLLSTHQRSGGNRVAIVTNAGGLGVLAADRAVELNLRVDPPSPATLAQLDEALPRQWSHGNPVDIVGDAPPERYHTAVHACLDDPAVDGVLVMLAPQAMTEPLDAAREVLRAAEGSDKPVLTCWMGGAQVRSARELFTERRIPSFPSPETAVEAFAYLAAYHENQKLLLQVPGPLIDPGRPDSEAARLIVQGVLGEDRETLSTTESKAVLTAFRIPVATALFARSADDALVAAESVGFPVALKIDSPDITHKSDVGGVRLDVGHAADVRGAYEALVARVQEARPDARIDGVTVERMRRMPNARELLIGASRDAALGPIVTFGAGGTAVELVRDSAVALPPLNGFIARDLIRRTRVSTALDAFRQLPPARVDLVEQILIRVSEMICELPQIRELDINPLLVDEREAVAVDARIVVEQRSDHIGRYDHMAIHPYPIELESRQQLPDGTDICIRPIRPEDADIEQSFVRSLSDESRYFRFMSTLSELTQEMLVRFTQIDYDREMAFIATTEEDGVETEIGVARYVTEPDGESCEFALVVGDEWHRRGIGSALMRRLMRVAGERGLKTMRSEVLASNTGMLKLLGSLGFSASTREADVTVQAVSRRLGEG